jgi:hypothetical protein
MESIHKNPQTFPVKKPFNAKNFAHDFTAQYGAHRHAAG